MEKSMTHSNMLASFAAFGLLALAANNALSQEDQNDNSSSSSAASSSAASPGGNGSGSPSQLYSRQQRAYCIDECNTELSGNLQRCDNGLAAFKGACEGQAQNRFNACNVRCEESWR
jgi:hypothetical protein